MSNPSEGGKIRKLWAREILDSRGFPTVEAEVWIEDERNPDRLVMGRAAVPSGASTGEGEALELRDGDAKRYLGKGVRKAVGHVRDQIAPALVGRAFSRQTLLDDGLMALDGTENKSKLGANAILAVSMAFARARAAAAGVPLYRSIAELMGSQGQTLPVPLMNVVNGGAHADNGLNLQEFMLVPLKFDRFSEALRAGTEVFHHLKKILKSRGLSTAVGDEGGFAPRFEGAQPHEQALNALTQAISDAGYKPGRDIFLALDCAASEFAERAPGSETQFVYKFEDRRLSAGEMAKVYAQWADTYPIVSIEDGLAEHDWAGWRELTDLMGRKCQLVGDDLFVTNPKFLQKGITGGVAISILIKLNQIGSVTETLETMRLAAQSSYSAIASHRSGETEDTFIADLAVGTDCGQIKTGSASRTDRIAKYNQLLRIEEELGEKARYSAFSAFPWLEGR
ncbi:MAG: phosphopyruvate hydratase [Bdellovibrionales bacterium]|nr:phosphopyruvate hydratase [Bdellovibrionales bacterium]